MHQEIDSVHFYITMRDADTMTKTAYLLGPYLSHDEAAANVDAAKFLACGVNPYHHFDAFGVASLPDHLMPKTAFESPDATGKRSARLEIGPLPGLFALEPNEDQQECEA